MKLPQKNIQFLSLKCYHLRIICQEATQTDILNADAVVQTDSVPL